MFSGKYIKDKCETCEGSGKVDQPKEVKIDVPGIDIKPELEKRFFKLVYLKEKECVLPHMATKSMSTSKLIKTRNSDDMASKFTRMLIFLYPKLFLAEGKMNAWGAFNS